MIIRALGYFWQHFWREGAFVTQAELSYASLVHDHSAQSDVITDEVERWKTLDTGLIQKFIDVETLRS